MKSYKQRRNRKRRNKTHRRQRQHRGGALTQEQQQVATFLTSDLHYTAERMNMTLQTIFKSACVDATSCMSLGQYMPILLAYFKQFEDLSMIRTTDVKRLSAGHNGFVLSIPFQRASYTAYSIMKSAVKPDPKYLPGDNLYYEYFIGKFFINALNNRFPTFIETYGLWEYDSISALDMARDYTGTGGELPLHLLIRKLPLTISWADACSKLPRVCFFSQYFRNCPTVHTYLKDKGTSVTDIELLSILYQVYFTLSVLDSNYTHYDLHTGNVLLFQPMNSSTHFLWMKYHLLNGSVLAFPTTFICKIIDYGRNYFNQAFLQNPKYTDTGATIKQRVCAETTACPRCGRAQGFSALFSDSQGDLKYINANMPNISADLRFMNIIVKTRPIARVTYLEQYGTPENTSPGEMRDGLMNINNVHDARRFCEQIIVNNNASNPSWYDGDINGRQCAGSIHVYENGQDYRYDANDAAQPLSNIAASVAATVPYATPSVSPNVNTASGERGNGNSNSLYQKARWSEFMPMNENITF